jgi:protease-4
MRRAPLGRPLRRFPFPPLPRPAPRLAVVPISRLIKPGPSVRWPGSQMAGAESVAADLARAREDRRVRAVIVWVDSPGGAANASDLMWHAVRRCAAEKPTVAYVDRVAASGGYFAASGARRIVAAPSALVGSIGAFVGRFDATRLVARLGIRQQVILRGAHAGILEPAHPLGDGERAALDRSVAETYEEFLERVALGRGVDRAAIEAVAEGRVFVAADAPSVLVDEVAGFPAALSWVAREAGIAPEDASLTRFATAGLRPGLREILALAQGAATIQPWLLWDDLLDIGPCAR